MRVHLIHGIHTSQPGGTVAKLAPYFERYGFEVVVHNYGYAFALTSRFQNPGRAEDIADEIDIDDVVVGHSNGCAIAWLIQEEHIPFKGAVLINPALDNDKAFRNVEWADVYFNQGDKAVPLANFFLFGHPWGDMGQKGYVNGSDVMNNIDTYRTEGMPAILGHSRIFHDELLMKWGPFIVERVLKRVNSE